MEGTIAAAHAAPASGTAGASRRHVTEAEAKGMLASYGVATPARRVAATIDQALAALSALSAPVAVKLVSSALHKSDVGGVRLNVADAQAMRDAVSDIDAAAARHGIEVEGYLVEEMASPGVEVIVGGMIDATFGPAVLVGIGGIFTEIMDDVSVRICPIARKDALAMIHELRASKLLLGARGRTPVDIESLASIILAIGGEKGFLVEHQDRVAEIDLNPVIVSAKGAVAVDARIVMREGVSDAR